MAGILGAVWAVLSSYRPGAAASASQQRRARRFGAFVPTYWYPVWRRPQNDADAQRLYNHIRTLAFWLDASPALADLGLPFRAGLDDIISLVPLYGDIASGVVQLYAVALCALFGVPALTLGWMLLNVLLDVVVGIVPVIGDVLDNLFKSNLRNLALLEAWLLKEGGYRILLMPDGKTYLPEPGARGGRKWASWFGVGGGSEAAQAGERERATGSIKKTRRMRKDEAGAWREAPYATGVDPEPLD
ncbi:hypothetical protein Q8F55_001817 [Vanrija albida]|uniref:Uncharacterized protein n=1 Tax=Vanrija albida TaxID=181172 RepID=A0ABR3Q817_9TREE